MGVFLLFFVKSCCDSISEDALQWFVVGPAAKFVLYYHTVFIDPGSKRVLMSLYYVFCITSLFS